jgi:hypothetical protein
MTGNAPKPVQSRTWWNRLNVDKAITVGGFALALSSAGCPMPGAPPYRQRIVTEPTPIPSVQPIEEEKATPTVATPPVLGGVPSPVQVNWPATTRASGESNR